MKLGSCLHRRLLFASSRFGRMLILASPSAYRASGPQCDHVIASSILSDALKLRAAETEAHHLLCKPQNA
jgi:hypothetical protein